jgi:hypothetical protein
MASIISAGTTDATSLNVSSDKTGILQLASNNAVTAITIDALQNVGIGTTSPAAFGGTNLQVQNSTLASVLWSNGTITGQLLCSSGAEVTVGSRSNHPLRFGTNDTERMRIDTSGNVLIATTNAITGITGAQLTVSNTSENPAYINIFRDDTTIGSGQFLGYLQFCGRDATSSLGTAHAYVAAVAEADHGAGDNATAITFGTTPDNSSTMSERMRIDASGSVGIGVTPDTNFFLTVQSTSDDNKNAVKLNQASTSLRTQISFNNPNGQTGTIQTNGSATAYNTSSDYRLKENITPMTGALAKVAQLKPVTYKWKVDGSDGEGFIAHELAEVKPDCVSGEKDAVDADGKPVYQGIDVSFLVATLTAAIQELKAINDTQAETINALTARIVALEGK